ncbi:hypothetical protein N7495_003660 [Penicillium taxi]|uniref:uncharacterized protein n=1 Tax=Penicillium taxi TaxID=168475 RepID=UPI0025458940|nr:uncharacterized protein N7495_003660 [Penicillium taxi]KAJ5898916.1 hypothetical protein N7495_003660 [Penicillium taxi]
MASITSRLTPPPWLPVPLLDSIPIESDSKETIKISLHDLLHHVKIRVNDADSHIARTLQFPKAT